MTDQLNLFDTGARLKTSEPAAPELPPTLPPAASEPAGDIPSPADRLNSSRLRNSRSGEAITITGVR